MGDKFDFTGTPPSGGLTVEISLPKDPV